MFFEFKRRKANQGFSIIELVVVVTIIGVLATVVGVNYGNWQDTATATELKSDLLNIASTAESYRTFNNAYPTSVPSSIKVSSGITVTGGSSDGKNFCYEATSSRASDITYYIDNSTSKSGAMSGTCASRPGAPSAPTGPGVSVTLVGDKVQAAVDSITCASGTTAQYAVKSKLNNEDYTNYSSFSTVQTYTQPANDGVKYTYLAKARCGADISSAESEGSPASYIDPIAAPSAPTVAINVVGGTTTWSWAAATCIAGTTPGYQYRYTITPAGYDSGWSAISTTAVAFTTVVYNQTFAVNVQSTCFNSNIASSWSASGSNSRMIVAIPPTVTTPTVASITANGAKLGANIVSNNGTAVTSYGVCWGTAPSPVTNCQAIPNGTLMPIGATTAPSGIMTISPDGTSAYVVSVNMVYMYSRNTSTGILTALGTPTIAAGVSPMRITISPNGASVYVTNNGDNSISMYSRNTSTGALTALGTPTIATGSFPDGITVSSDGTSVYSANAGGNISMYSRNTSTGALTALGTPTIATGVSPNGIVISADGKSVYVSNYSDSTISMYSRNTGTGALTALGTPTVNCGGWPYDITISPDGTSVYTANWYDGNVSEFSRNTSTGILTDLYVSATAGTHPQDIVITPDGATVYVSNSGSDTVSMYSRNLGTGALTPMSTPTITSTGSPDKMVVSADGKFFYVSNDSLSATYVFNIVPGGSVFAYPRTGMPAVTTIYYRGFATSGAGTGYSADGSFTTSQTTFQLAGTSAGAATQGAASASVTPTWGINSNRIAGNLLICTVSVNVVATLPATPAGWTLANSVAGTSTSAAIFYKIATGGDSAPTIAGISTGIIAARLAEYSGGSAASILDKTGSAASGITTPRTATSTAPNANSAGELIVTSSSLYYAGAATKTLTDSINNATKITSNNAATSTRSHFDFSYGFSTSNASADSNSFAFTTTNITGTASVIASFKP